TLMGLESTVIGFDGGKPVLLRTGAIAREAIEKIVGPLDAPSARIQSPGQLASHYAPRGSVRLNARDAQAGETLLGFGSNAPKDAMNLSVSGDLREAAANLFAMLHALNDKDAIAVMPIPETGLGEAINDRLKRAAAPRGAA
ncbi:MAG: translation factor Sua5, partial [Alphaproteobacteria bacterium]|nr:translation factor Sua5 [Alphaproteobacteria bacterium]